MRNRLWEELNVTQKAFLVIVAQEVYSSIIGNNPPEVIKMDSILDDYFSGQRGTVGSFIVAISKIDWKD